MTKMKLHFLPLSAEKSKRGELTKSLAQSVTRRTALKKFATGVVGMTLGSFGLANTARSAKHNGYCEAIGPPPFFIPFYNGRCIDAHGCITGYSADCPANGVPANPYAVSGVCGDVYGVEEAARCSFIV
jgi:hypothetical protein